jgi:hypothetical protein
MGVTEQSDDQGTSPVAASRECIVVAGMHRSGTSALTRVLNLLGAKLPKHVMGARDSNEQGHWEPERLVALHDELFAEAGTRWDDISRFPASFDPERFAHYKAEIVRILGEEYGDASLVVVKDPRICRLIPLWREVLEQIGVRARFVIPLRNPLEVARSLEKRNGISLAYGCLLWLRHLLDAEYGTRGARRVFVHYHDLLNNPIRTAREVASHVADGWPAMNKDAEREIGVFVDIAQCHHFAKLEELRYPVAAYQMLKETYEACAALVYHPADEKTQSRLDGVRTAFESAAMSFALFLPAHEEALRVCNEKIAALDQMLAAQKAALREQGEKISALSEMLAARADDAPAL